jgi:hypothetical protein
MLKFNIRLIRSAVVLCWLLTLASHSAAMDPAKSFSELDYLKTIELGFRPTSLKLFDDEPLVALGAKASETKSRLALFDIQDGKMRKSVDVPHLIEAIMIDRHSKNIASAGRDADLTGVSKWSLETGKLKSLFMEGRAQAPSVRFCKGTDICVSDLTSRVIRIAPSTMFSDPDGPHEAVLKDYQYSDPTTGRAFNYFGPGTIRNFDFATDESVLFVVDSKESLLTAVGRAEGWQQVSELGYTSTKETIATALGFYKGPPLSGTDEYVGATIIVGDNNLGRLQLTDFDSDFKTFAIIADTEIKFDLLPNSDLAEDSFKTADGTVLIDPPILIDASDDQRVILVGNRFSRTVFLFARIEKRLELIRKIQLPDAPDFLDVTTDGQTAVAAGRRSSALYVLSAPKTGVPDTSRTTEGKPEIRALQRALSDVGYPIGAIDGIDGPITQRAVKQVLIRKNLDIDPQNVEALTQALENLNLSSE